MQTLDFDSGLHKNVLNSPSPSPVYTSDANTENIPRLITLTKTLIISDLTKTESNNTNYDSKNIIIVLLCFEENNVKHNLGWITVKLTLLLEIMHCFYKLQISQLSAGCSLRLLANENIVCVCNIITIIITITVI